MAIIKIDLKIPIIITSAVTWIWLNAEAKKRLIKKKN